MLCLGLFEGDEEDIESKDTMDIDVIILMFPNLQFSKNMVNPTACSQVGCVKIAINTYKVFCNNLQYNI